MTHISCKDVLLEKPLFYRNDFGLRFELGPPEIGVWDDFASIKVNEEYFEIALERALSIFEAVFSATDDVSITYQILSIGRRKIQKSNYLFKQIHDIKERKVIFTRYRDTREKDIAGQYRRWRRVTVSNIKVKDINTRNVLLALIHTDFSFRRPSLPGECFFINRTKGLVLDLYDDRGMDVVALERKTLQDLYKSHNANILDYDRERIDQVFA